MDWLTDNKLPIGRWAKNVVDWLTDNAEWLFDSISISLERLIEVVLWLLQAPPPLIFIAVVAAIGYAVHRKISFVIFVLLSLMLIVNLGYWEETTETLALVIVATIVCMALGVPTGVLAAHRPGFFAVLRPVLDLMQTVPTFAYLIPGLVLFGIGMVPGLLATVIFAAPAPIRLTQLGVSSTPKALIEAGEAFGATKSQLLWKVELPYALPQIMAGLTQTIMLSLSMVVVAALVGADGLGVPILRALNSVNIPMGFEAGLCIVLIAIVLDRFFRSSEGGKR
ncbi:choline ABC transporter permease subunit [Roseibium album]|uniref:choline ABC transporter permease subunit n=1 Tax=Roseibium album TaxID=311410 RepID=UPI0024926D0E|nr:choline ABC transporter permease subunit [Roseibium album]